MAPAGVLTSTPYAEVAFHAPACTSSPSNSTNAISPLAGMNLWGEGFGSAAAEVSGVTAARNRRPRAKRPSVSAAGGKRGASNAWELLLPRRGAVAAEAVDTYSWLRDCS